MIEFIERSVVRLLRIPPEPELASGSREGVEAFRASAGYFHLRLVGWGVNQLSAALGILAFLWFTGMFDFEIPVALVNKLAEYDVTWPRSLTQERIAGMSILDGLFVLEILGILFFLVQLPVSLAMLRLDYRLRWYVLTDRSLQIRSGVWNVQEQTLSLANIQNVRLEQGPLERMFGFAGVKVRTAGGGSSGDSGDDDADNAEEKALHVGWLRGLDDAGAVRDRIVDAVRRHRDSGLGNPRERPAATLRERPAEGEPPEQLAARELLAEIRDWRSEIAGRTAVT